MTKPARKLKFEEAMQRLDAIVEAMESGEIGIEDLIARYEEAMQLKAHCQQILDQAELRIRKIQSDGAGGAAIGPSEPAPSAPAAPDSANDQ